MIEAVEGGWSEWVEVPSSNVLKFRYFTDEFNPLLNVLEVTFDPTIDGKRGSPRRGDPKTYQYIGVPPAVFQDFQHAASWGRFVWRRLRGVYQTLGPY